LNREQAVVIAKEMVASKIVEPFWISIENRRNSQCRLRLKAKGLTKEALSAFVAKNNLLLEEENEYWLISKP
jgi:hypothetical protein